MSVFDAYEGHINLDMPNGSNLITLTNLYSQNTFFFIYTEDVVAQRA